MSETSAMNTDDGEHTRRGKHGLLGRTGLVGSPLETPLPVLESTKKKVYISCFVPGWGTIQMDAYPQDLCVKHHQPHFQALLPIQDADSGRHI